MDPTLLVDPDYYSQLANETPQLESKTVLKYVLDEQLLAGIDDKDLLRGKLEGLDVKSIMLDGIGGSITIARWLDAFKCARFVITDSFHGMVFSILFGKQFVVVANSMRGRDRFDSLLGLLGLRDRLLERLTEDDMVRLVGQGIDYAAVNERIAQLRLASRNFLNEALA